MIVTLDSNANGEAVRLAGFSVRLLRGGAYKPRTSPYSFQGHGAGRRDLIAPLCRAAIAAGAAGLMIETHDDPGRALSDGSQALPIEEIAEVQPCPRETSQA